MASLFGDPRYRQVRSTLLFVASAAAAALALLFAWEYPWAGLAGLLGLVLGLLLRWRSRRRAAAVLRSGDVRRVIARWAEALEQVPHADTMGPLMTATALAAYGWLERARHVLRTAQRGRAWEAAVEHRLFVEALLLTFEGQAELALERASALQHLPMPSSAPWLVGRIRTLRQSVSALARAFAHAGREGDRQLLLRAGDASPLVYWAMRYGAAVLSVDAGDLAAAEHLLRGAPAWPDESCFREFHREIQSEVHRLAARSESTEHSSSDAVTPPPAAGADRDPRFGSPAEPKVTNQAAPASSGGDEEQGS